MQDEERLDPEKLLAVIKSENSQQGDLKIFLGMSAGVGKTYAMLEEAQQLKRQGVDVAVGIVDTHGRQETAALLEGLRIIPLKSIRYRDHLFNEMDIDEIIHQCPEVVLIDELAHSNIQGSRHLKRWQDVLEILNEGINVYTTVNIQHIESLKDIIESLGEVVVKETVPDIVIGPTTTIQLVDLAPEELLVRLKEGKIYLKGQSYLAACNFFKKDRLTALREIALRYTAEIVTRDLRGMIFGFENIEKWTHREKILIAVSDHPHSQKLIRMGRRLAFNLNIPWMCLHVDTGRSLTESSSEMLEKNLALARLLGAEIITTSDPDIIVGIQRVVSQNKVTQLIVGRSYEKSFLPFFREYSVHERLTRSCPNVDLLVTREETTTRDRKDAAKIFQFSKWLNFLAVSLCSLVLIIVGWSFQVDYPVIFSFYFLLVLLAVVFFKFKDQRKILKKREKATLALYEIIRFIARRPSSLDVIKFVKEQLEPVVNGRFEIVIKGTEGGLVFTDSMWLLNEEDEKLAAKWAFKNSCEAGWMTQTFSGSKNLYIPLKGNHETVGVFVYRSNEKNKLFTDERNFLYAVSQQLSYYFERLLSDKSSKEKDQHFHAEKIYTSIFSSLSKKLKTPFEGIQDSVHELHQSSDQEQIGKVIHKIESSLEKSFRILDAVTLLAKIGKNNGSTIPINKKTHRIEKLIKDCASKLKKSIPSHKLDVEVQEGLPAVLFDDLLMEILVDNLLLNASKYSPIGSTITIKASQEESFIVISISDEGDGIPPDKIDSIFDHPGFLPETKFPGAGLGLTITKKIAEIHHGILKAENLPNKGCRFSFFLPIQKSSDLKREKS